MNHYKDFLNLIGDENLNELINLTPGNEAAKKAINDIYETFKKGQKIAELDEKFSQCLALNVELWFNIGWSAGWSAGAVVILKMAGLDKPEATNIIKTINLEPG